jgi:glycerol uptake facilitator-like aquaporin
MNKLIIEFLSTMVFTFIIFASGNYLVIGATLAILIYLSNGYALVNPVIALAKWLNGTFNTTYMFKLMLVEVIGAVLGLYAYKFIYNI